MIDFIHAYQVVMSELPNYNSAAFLVDGFIVWVTASFVKRAYSFAGKVFWLMFSIILAMEIFKSNAILFNELFYIDIAIFFTHIDVLIIAYKRYVPKKSEVTILPDKPIQTFGLYGEALEKRNQEIALQKQKNEREKELFKKLQKKLDSF